MIERACPSCGRPSPGENHRCDVRGRPADGNGGRATPNGQADPAGADLDRQLDALERSQGHSRPIWPWLVMLAGLVVMVVYGLNAYAAYTAIESLELAAGLETANVLSLFSGLTIDGIQVRTGIDARNRAEYVAALEQIALAGTMASLGLLLVLAGLFVAANLRGRRSPD